MDMNENKSQLNIILDRMTDDLLSGREVGFSEQLHNRLRNAYNCRSVSRSENNDPLRLTVKRYLALFGCFISLPHNN